MLIERLDQKPVNSNNISTFGCRNVKWIVKSHLWAEFGHFSGTQPVKVCISDYLKIIHGKFLPRGNPNFRWDSVLAIIIN